MNDPPSAMTKIANGAISKSGSSEAANTVYTEALASVPQHLRIQVLYSDDDIVVIHKPPNLRSVPGHASPTKSDSEAVTTHNKRKLEDNENVVVQQQSLTKNAETMGRKTGQEAWIAAIQQLTSEEQIPTKNTSDCPEDKIRIQTCLQRLAYGDTKNNNDKSKLASIPRKLKAFTRYVERNHKRILAGSSLPSSMQNANDLAQTLYRRIEQVQKVLLNIPQSTSKEESAFGQLELLFSSSCSSSRVDQSVFVVHRLDCETSGVMVFARTSSAAATLSATWRSGNVTKVYHALVKGWLKDTLDDEKSYGPTPQNSGEIRVCMAPHPTERLKWRVVENKGESDDTKIKTSKTCWKVLSTKHDISLLELKPITGRTHQLRVHCAYRKSPILGDSLYSTEDTLFSRSNSATNEGDGLVDRNPAKCHSSTKQESSELKQRLCLHAYHLSFPHPTMKEKRMSFSTEPGWTYK